VLRPFNVLTGSLDVINVRPGYRWRGARGLGRALGGERIGASVYDLPDGQRSFPYHYHHGVEEWLYVLDGAPVVRLPEGDRVLAPGDSLRFPDGPDGAHSVRGPGRVLVFSCGGPPSISVYPDSDKLGTRPVEAERLESDRLNFRRSDAVDYWEGE